MLGVKVVRKYKGNGYGAGLRGGDKILGRMTETAEKEEAWCFFPLPSFSDHSSVRTSKATAWGVAGATTTTTEGFRFIANDIVTERRFGENRHMDEQIE